MSSPPNFSTAHFILCVSTIFLLFSSIQGTVLPPLIQQVCFNRSVQVNSNSCARILRSDQRVASAKTLLDLSIAIMKAGRRNATSLQAYVKNQLKHSAVVANSGVKAALKECRSSYKMVSRSFRNALISIGEDEYLSATYELQTGNADNLRRCIDVVANSGVKDGKILRGNAALRVYLVSAFEAVNRL